MVVDAHGDLVGREPLLAVVGAVKELPPRRVAALVHRDQVCDGLDVEGQHHAVGVENPIDRRSHERRCRVVRDCVLDELDRRVRVRDADQPARALGAVGERLLGNAEQQGAAVRVRELGNVAGELTALVGANALVGGPGAQCRS